MQSFLISLPFSDAAVRLSAFLNDGAENAPAILVLPGGGYHLCAPGEGAPVAERFAALGYQAFLLEYSTLRSDPGHTLFPEPLLEVRDALRHIRAHAAEYGIDSRRIALFGASAGGHLAANYCNLWNTPLLCTPDSDAAQQRPDACVLLYGATELSGDNMMLRPIFGHDAPYSEAELRAYTAKYHVGSQTPPTILFHSAEDPMVNAAQSAALYAALRSAGIAAELHIFSEGGHAYGLGAGISPEIWPTIADRFLHSLRK